MRVAVCTRSRLSKRFLRRSRPEALRLGHTLRWTPWPFGSGAIRGRRSALDPGTEADEHRGVGDPAPCVSPAALRPGMRGGSRASSDAISLTDTSGKVDARRPLALQLCSAFPYGVRLRGPAALGARARKGASGEGPAFPPHGRRLVQGPRLRTRLDILREPTPFLRR